MVYELGAYRFSVRTKVPPKKGEAQAYATPSFKFITCDKSIIVNTRTRLYHVGFFAVSTLIFSYTIT